jgi:hypothetical protein
MIGRPARRLRRALSGAVLGAACAASACGPGLRSLPSSPGHPSADAIQLLDEAMRECRAVKTFTAVSQVSGSAGGRRVPRLRMDVGVVAPDAARLEAVASFGTPVFVFAARSGRATVLLPRDNLVLEREAPQAVLEALTGVPFDVPDLLATLTGCAGHADAGSGREPASDWRSVQSGADAVYLHREGDSGAWRVVATVHRNADGFRWRTDYAAFAGALPQSVRLTSLDSSRFDLRLSLTQVETNAPVPDAAFDVRVPLGAQAITLQELREIGPLARQPSANSSTSR